MHSSFPLAASRRGKRFDFSEILPAVPKLRKAKRVKPCKDSLKECLLQDGAGLGRPKEQSFVREIRYGPCSLPQKSPASMQSA